jgi:hypothetical protein
MGSLGERVAKLQHGERIVLERAGDAGRWVAQMTKGPGLLASLRVDFPHLAGTGGLLTRDDKYQ